MRRISTSGGVVKTVAAKPHIIDVTVSPVSAGFAIGREIWRYKPASFVPSLA